MPKSKKYTTKKAKRFLLNYGYIVPDNFTYETLNERINGLYDVYNDKKVNLSIAQIERQVYKATNKRPKNKDPEGIERLMNIDFQPGRIQIDHDERQQMYNFLNDIDFQPTIRQQYDHDERIYQQIPETMQYIDYYIPVDQREDVKNKIKQKVPAFIKDIKKALKKVKPGDNDPTLLIEHVNPHDPNEQEALKNALLLSLKKLRNDLLKLNCNIILTSSDGHQKKFYFNENSLDLLESALFHHDIPVPGDTNEEIISLYFLNDIASVTFEFTPFKNGNRTNPGFFPFINLSTIDLSDFGIYGKDDNRRYTESCLILAIRQSGVLNEEEMKRLQHFVKTRTFLLEQLPEICKEFDVQIDLRIMNNDKTSTRSYGESEKKVKLIVMFGHYMIDKLPNVSSFFLNNYEEFKNENTMTFKNKEGQIKTTKSSVNIRTVIFKLIDLGLLIPMTDEEMVNVKVNFNMFDDVSFNHQRLVRVPNIKEHKYNPYTVKPKQTKFFFGYEPEDNEVDDRLNELQTVIDSLPLRHHIKVSDYYRYSNLMQRIMLEYGCFDGVYESTGEMNQKLRSEIKYPRPFGSYNDGKPFAIKEKLYYIDMNSSYMSFINGIPTDLSMTKRNYKINDLIKTMFKLRCEVKRTNPKLATTIKFLMNSCFGFSLRKQKLFKNKYSKNLDNYINNYSPFIFAVYVTDDNKGFVHSKSSFATDYNCVQFGYDILKNYNEFMRKIKDKVNVIYENIDAILISENDYDKLKEEGLIGSDLGQFKVEHVFTSFEYISPRKWRGVDEKGEITTRGKW